VEFVRLTMGIAAVVVPLNIVFGLAAAWSVTSSGSKAALF